MICLGKGISKVGWLAALVWSGLGAVGCGQTAASNGAAASDTAAAVDSAAPTDSVDAEDLAPSSDLGASDGGNSTTAAACLAHTPSEDQCKDCCDCLDLPCEQVIACRDACPGHDFKANDGSLTVSAPSVFGADGDYGVCTAAAGEQACKSCCECENRFVCGDKRHCRDACVAAQSGFPALKMTQLGAPVLIASDLQFAEGPVWDATLGALLFTDISADTIYRLDLPDKRTVFRKPAQQANGLAIDKEGRLLAAEQGSRRVTRTAADAKVTTIADKWQGKALNSPNDLVVAADGTIYFSDPTYGLGNTPSELGFTGLYRIAPDGTLSLEAKIDGQPNGVALSPDAKTLYVAATTANQLLTFSIGVGGVLSNQQVLHAVDAPDGMAVDQAGNLYIAALDGAKGAVVVLDKLGKKIGTIPLAQQPTNCGFGGADHKTLFITARTALYRVDVPIPGL